MSTFSVAATVFLALVASFASAQEIKLWPKGAPGALGEKDEDIPTLTQYFRSERTKGAPVIVICPGGGYGGLADHEGKDYALYLNSKGLDCFVLKYRLGSHGYRHPIELGDAARALRYVRSHAEELQVDPNKIGIMGSSAGGHLASTLLTHFDAGDPNATDEIDKVSSRPDFGILCYAVITMGEFTHQGSKDNLLGPNPSQELVDELSNEKKVTSQTPPCFIWHTYEDGAVPVENSLMFAEALRKNKVPFDLHIYEKGGHGIGLNTKLPFENVHPWAKELVFWLTERGILEKPARTGD